MRILFYTTQLGPRYHQGSERYVETLGGSLEAVGHEVVYLAGDPLGAAFRAEPGACVDRERRLHAYPTSDWMAIEGIPAVRVKPWLRDLAPDLVHAASTAHVGVGLLQACYELDIPVVITTMDFWWICPRATLLHEGTRICSGAPGWLECVRCVASDHPQRLLPTLAALPRWASPGTLAVMSTSCARRGHRTTDSLRWLKRRALLGNILRGASQVIFPSQALRRALAPGLSQDRCTLIPYGLADKWFESPKTGPVGARSPAELRVGFAGSLQPHKGAHLLLEAIRLLDWRSTRVRIAGGSDDAAYLERLAQTGRELQVEYAGSLGEEEMIAFLRDLDLLVVPSRWPENLPFVLLEAQAAGVPVIASRVEGMAGSVGDPARLFEADSPEDLARALKDFCESEGEPAPSRVGTAEEMRIATEAVYQRARRTPGGETSSP